MVGAVFLAGAARLRLRPPGDGRGELVKASLSWSSEPGESAKMPSMILQLASNLASSSGEQGMSPMPAACTTHAQIAQTSGSQSKTHPRLQASQHPSARPCHERLFLPQAEGMLGAHLSKHPSTPSGPSPAGASPPPEKNSCSEAQNASQSIAIGSARHSCSGAPGIRSMLPNRASCLSRIFQFYGL